MTKAERTKIVLAAATRDLLCLLGAGSVSFGVYLIYPPASFIVGGIFCLMIGLLGALRS